MRQKRSNWKAAWIKKQKQDRRQNPNLKAHKYACRNGHIRIENKRLADSDLDCPACAEGGAQVKFSYVGGHSISSHQYSKSRFNNDDPK